MIHPSLKIKKQVMVINPTTVIFACAKEIQLTLPSIDKSAYWIAW